MSSAILQQSLNVLVPSWNQSSNYSIDYHAGTLLCRPLPSKAAAKGLDGQEKIKSYMCVSFLSQDELKLCLLI